MFENNEYIINNNINYNELISKLINGYKNRIINNKFYNKIIHYQDLNIKEIVIKGLAHNGNCYYNCVSKFLFDDEIISYKEKNKINSVNINNNIGSLTFFRSYNILYKI